MFFFIFCLIKDIVGLACGHECCDGCFCKYVTEKITDENAAELICCPAENCDKIVDSDLIMQMISDVNVRQMYQHLWANSFVQVSTNYSQCGFHT